MLPCKLLGADILERIFEYNTLQERGNIRDVCSMFQSCVDSLTNKEVRRGAQLIFQIPREQLYWRKHPCWVSGVVAFIDWNECSILIHPCSTAEMYANDWHHLYHDNHVSWILNGHGC